MQKAPRRRAMMIQDSVDREADAWLAELPWVDSEVEMARMRLLRLGRQMERMLSLLAERHGMTSGDWETLSVLQRSGAPFTMSPTALAEALRITSGTISVRLDRLENAGLVERAEGGSDARIKPVRLTDAGRSRWREATKARTAIEERLIAGVLGMDGVRKLNVLLRSVMHSFELEFGSAPRRLEETRLSST